MSSQLSRYLSPEKKGTRELRTESQEEGWSPNQVANLRLLLREIYVFCKLPRLSSRDEGRKQDFQAARATAFSIFPHFTSLVLLGIVRGAKRSQGSPRSCLPARLCHSLQNCCYGDLNPGAGVYQSALNRLVLP